MPALLSAHRFHFVLLALVASMLAACAGSEPREDDGPARRAAEKAYRPRQQDATVEIDDTWVVGGQGIAIALERPNRAGPLPVVIYLPGLGESRSAGDQWREAWAHAGYAVLSVQPLTDDALAWQSDLARDGEFRALGREHFSAPMMARRLQVLQGVVDEGRRRAAAGGWQGLDWGTVALAGYDLGAYAAMAAAGEHVVPGGSTLALGPPTALRAVIVLSPFASRAQPDSDTRYRDIRVPVLAITSDADGDPLGLIDSPEQRLIPYDRVTGRPAWLLSLRGMPHAALAGNAAYETTRAEAARSERARTAADGQQRQRSGGRQGGGRGNYGEDTFGPGGSSNRARYAAGAGRDAPGLSRLGLQWRVDAARDVSTAFLDASMRNDPAARAWLAGDSAARIEGVGQLQGK